MTIPEVLSANESRRARVLLWTIVLLGAALRIYGVLRHPVDQDELYTVAESRDLYATSLAPGIQSRPLYYVVQHVLFLLTPAHEPWTRLMPLFAGVAGIYLAARLASRIAGTHAGLITALVTACSPWHAYASEMARYYSVVFALVATSLLSFLHAREQGTRSAWFRAAIPVSIGVLVHPSFALAIIVALGLATWRGRLDAPRWRVPSAAIWLGFAPLCTASLAFLVYSTVNLGPRRGVDNGGARLAEANLRLFPALLEWASPVVFTAGVLGLTLLVSQSGDRSRREAGAMLSGVVVSTLLLVVLASSVTATYADYAIGMLPALFVGVGILSAWISRGSPARTALLGTLLAAAMSPSLASHVNDGTRFDYRPAFDTIRNVAPQRVALVWPEATAAYYASDLRRVALSQSSAALDSVLTMEKIVWAVVSEKRFGIVSSSARDLPTWLASHCVEVRRFERMRFDYRQYGVSLQECRR